MYLQDTGRHQRKRVLVIDDEPMVTDWLKMIIEQAPSQPGYEVRVASHGARAEEFFSSWKPAVVLLDLCCPTQTASSCCAGSRRSIRRPRSS